MTILAEMTVKHTSRRYPAARLAVLPPLARLGGVLLFLVAASACEEGVVGAPRLEYGPAGTRGYQEGTMLYLERVEDGHRTRVGLEERWGGSLVEVSLDETNFVNAFDAGREIQISLYDGNNTYDDCAGCRGAWGWNPVQGGDKHTNGSVVLEKRIQDDELYIKVQPNHWLPDTYGGGGGRPVRSDIVVEQWITPVADHPTAFKLTYRVNHMGDDSHAATGQQEFPAVYVNRAFDRFVHYAGSAPWTSDRVTTSSIPNAFVEPQARLHTSEWWGAYVNDRNLGLTIFTPGSFPYMTSAMVPGTTGPQGTGAAYTHPYTPFGIRPRSVIQGDIYLIVGDYHAARKVVYDLAKTVPVNDIAAPIGEVSVRQGDVRGALEVTGWAYDNVGVASAEILVDGILAGQATLGQFRPDVREIWAGAPSRTGFVFKLDSSRYADGDRKITLRLTDSAGSQNEISTSASFRNLQASTRGD